MAVTAEYSRKDNVQTMNTEQQVLASKSAQEAMLILARALDRIEEHFVQDVTPDWLSGWTQTHPEEVWPSAAARTEITGNEEHIDVAIPPTSEAKQERRRQFERQHLHLADYLPEGEDWTEAYAKGGPRWLYYGNRELVTSYPDSTKQAMIEDIIEDSPEEAHEIGRDLLKQPFDSTGPSRGLPIAEGDVG